MAYLLPLVLAFGCGGEDDSARPDGDAAGTDSSPADVGDANDGTPDQNDDGTSSEPALPAGPLAFVTRDDPPARALTAALTAFSLVPASQEEVDQQNQLSADAARGITADPAAAFAIVRDGLRNAGSDLGAHVALFHLLSRIATPDATALLRDQALRELPRPSGEHDSPRMAVASIRRAAIRTLGQIASEPRSDARSRLIELVVADDAEVRSLAARTYLGTSADRWRARRELRLLLPRADRHLLNRLE
jgi:hypothetical protein